MSPRAEGSDPAASIGVVELPTDDPRRDSRGLGIVLLVSALAAAVSRSWHPVAWWGWCGAGLCLLLAGWMFRHPTTRAQVCLEGDELVLRGGQRERRIPARDVSRVVSMSAADDLPVLQLRDGSLVPLPVSARRHGSATPTARIVADWVASHGGGDGTDLPAQLTSPVQWRVMLVGVLMLGAVYLCLAATLGGPESRWSNAVGSMLGLVLVQLLFRRRRARYDWSAGRYLVNE